MEAVEAKLCSDAADRLGLPDSLVHVWKCPVCGIRAFAGYLAPGAYLVIRCTKSNCAHHQKGCGWTASTLQPNTHEPDGKLLRCRSDFTHHPSPSGHDPIRTACPNYDHGRAVCNYPWAYGYLSRGSRIIVWCQQRTCANHEKGFTICPS